MTILLAFKNLFRNKRKSIAIVLTIAFGSGALFAFAGFNKGVLDRYREDTIHAHYGYGQINTKGYRTTVYQNPWDHWIYNWKKLKTFLLEQKGVEQVFPRVTFSALLNNGSVTVSGEGQGIDGVNEAEFFYGLNVEKGKQLTDEPYGMLIGKELAKALDVDVGDTVRVTTTASNDKPNKLDLTVTGIFHTGNQQFDSRVFRLQLAKAQDIMKTKDVEYVALGLQEGTNWNTLAEAIETHFPDLEATPFHILDKIFYQHAIDWLKAQFTIVRMIILSIVLLGIFNTISTMILERKQEIGNLRANGESVRDVMSLILLEGAFLGIIGGIFGISVTYILTKGFLDRGIVMPPGPGLTRNFYISFSYDWTAVFLTLILSLVTALLASFIAGLKVAKMSIAEALRSF